jgi:hypothetical protein
MGKKSGPSAPPPPDPVKTAAAQTQQNIKSATAQAELDRIDQYTPQGSSTYKIIGYNADGTPKYEQRTTLSADEQKKYDLNNQVAIALDQLAHDSVGRVNQIENTPFNYDGMTPLVTSVGGNNPYHLQNGPGVGSVKSDVGDVGQVRSATGQEGGQIQRGLDYSNLTALPGTGDFSADARRVADSVYGQAASRLDPRFQQDESDMRSRLAAQGISENSDAYRREMDNFARSKNDAYNQAAYSAQQAGSQEQSRIFGLAMGARQQGQNEANTQGNFANSAQQQAYDQAMGTLGQQNQAQGQKYDQAQAIAQLFNQAQQQLFSQGQASAAMNNTNQNTWFNQAGADAALSNSGRQQQIEEATYLRNLPLNDIAALLGTGAQVQMPNFEQVAQVGVAAPDYQGIVQNNYNQALNQYNQQQQARSQMMGQIFGTIGTAATMFSDARLKTDIRQIGELANGIKTYAFKYIGDKLQRFGVMAQDVLGIMPAAVRVASNGYMAVDYGKVFA